MERRIAVIGAGPVGLDAALAARNLGWPVTVYERGAGPGENVRRWGHVTLFTPWRMNVSPRMRRPLEARGWTVPDPGACPTGGELVERVLEPLAATPELSGTLRTGTRVVAVGRKGMVKSDAIGSPRRSEAPFRLLLRDASGREWTEEADVVLDCTGTFGNPNPLGDGGIPAPGEGAADPLIDRTIPDVAGAPGPWAGRTVLLVGAGHSAQTAARDLAALVDRAPDTRVVWAIRAERPTWGAVPDDPLPRRARLAASADELARGASRAVDVRTGVVVDRLERDGSGVRVHLRSRHESAGGDGAAGAGAVTVDRIVGLTGSVGDHTVYRQLQVHECYATSGPMKLAAALLDGGSADCLDQTGRGAETLENPEPRFFVLGEKSYGRNNTFLMRVGWEQVDEVFGLLEATAATA